MRRRCILDQTMNAFMGRFTCSVFSEPAAPDPDPELDPDPTLDPILAGEGLPLSICCMTGRLRRLLVIGGHTKLSFLLSVCDFRTSLQAWNAGCKMCNNL